MSYELSLILGVDELRIEGSDHGKSKSKTKSKESGKSVSYTHLTLPTMAVV